MTGTSLDGTKPRAARATSNVGAPAHGMRRAEAGYPVIPFLGLLRRALSVTGASMRGVKRAGHHTDPLLSILPGIRTPPGASQRIAQRAYVQEGQGASRSKREHVAYAIRPDAWPCMQ